MSDPADGALVAAYHRGDDAALSTLVQRYQAQAYRLAFGVLASREEAEEAAQETMIAMFSSLARFRGDSRFSTWFYRLALNTCLKRKRRPARSPEEPLADAASLADRPDRGPDVQAGRRWLRDRLARFLEALPESGRLPVVLSDALDLPLSEVASLLDISLPAAKARLLRGRRRLRQEIERYCEEAGLSGWRELVSD